jgi:hypothetical protein
MTLPCCLLLAWYWIVRTTCAEPLSKPYVAFRTDPFDQPIVAADHRIVDGGRGGTLNTTKSPTTSPAEIKRPLQYDEVHSSTCQMHFSLGLAKGVHVDRDESILAPPVLFPSLDGLGSDVVYTTSYEHVHLLKPGLPTGGGGGSGGSSSSSNSGSSSSSGGNIWKEVLVEPPRFPLLMESSVFLTAPIIHDINAGTYVRTCGCTILFRMRCGVNHVIL